MNVFSKNLRDTKRKIELALARIDKFEKTAKSESFSSIFFGEFLSHRRFFMVIDSIDQLAEIIYRDGWATYGGDMEGSIDEFRRVLDEVCERASVNIVASANLLQRELAPILRYWLEIVAGYLKIEE